MDVSLGLSQAAAAAAVLALSRGRSRPEAGSVYSLAAGRLLLQVSLARKGEPEAAVQAPGSEVLEAEHASLLAPGYRGPGPLAVRLLPSVRARVGRAARSVSKGFEPPLVGPARALVASALVSFGLAALFAGADRPAPKVGLPAASEAAAPRRLQEPALWERQMLLADVSAPTPHSFRRGRISTWNSHANTVPVHSNAAIVPHSNSLTPPHTNGAMVPHVNLDTRPYP